MACLSDYYVMRIVAISMASGLTGYSAWLSWSHFGEPSGPIAAVTGAGFSSSANMPGATASGCVPCSYLDWVLWHW